MGLISWIGQFFKSDNDKVYSQEYIYSLQSQIRLAHIISIINENQGEGFEDPSCPVCRHSDVIIKPGNNSPDFWMCAHCREAGNTISFMMRYRTCSFVQAIEELEMFRKYGRLYAF
jgi:hypothetical protein